ncbi:MAG: hypothetical protein KBC38_02900 [Candidatus Pacebacteria bacterium]|nr:hypothetical protein [Candidatus Paceibacterota bacterium]MBP9840093.1 hypothetical protein [Candidatus Paceibacterota bacterium]
MRKFLPILAVVIVLVGIAVALYFYLVPGDDGLVAEPGVTNPFEPVGDGETGGGGGVDDWGGDDPEEGTIGWGEDAGEGGTATDVAPRLVKITPGPVAEGAVALRRTDTATTSLETSDQLSNLEVRYAMRASGNLFTYLAAENRTVRISNRTIPGIERAAWLPNGYAAYLQAVRRDPDASEHIETTMVVSDGTSATALARDYASIDTAGERLLALTTTTGGASATVSGPDGTAARAAFSSPIAGLRAEFLGESFLATTKPSRDLLGYAFRIDGASGAFTRLLGPLYGLSAISNGDGSQVLFSYADGNAMRLSLYTLSTGTALPLPLQTLAEKCAFSPDNEVAYCAVPVTLSGASLPDSWYQGATHFTDRLWKIDFAARVTTVVADLPLLTKEPIDGVALTLNPEGTALVFTNRRDSSLWYFAL